MWAQEMQEANSGETCNLHPTLNSLQKNQANSAEQFETWKWNLGTGIYFSMVVLRDQKSLQ